MKYLLPLLLIICFTQQACSQKSGDKNNAAKSQKTIIVYGSPSCHYCVDTKIYLKENDVDFVFYDIDSDQARLQEMLDKLRKKNISTINLQIPVVEVSGDIYINTPQDFQTFLDKLVAKN